MKINLPEPIGSLFNGLETEAITGFYGAAGTGKTNLCIIAAFDCLKRGGDVIYIDTEGGFSKERFNQITNNNSLDRIKLIQPKSFSEQSKIIKGLESVDTNLIILDSAVALYRLESDNNGNGKVERTEANRDLSKQLSILSNISRDKKISILVTAHTYKNWDTGDNEIVGGDSLKYWSKSLIFLERTARMNERKATIVKHRSQPEGKYTKFMIVEDGIKPSGFKIF